MTSISNVNDVSGTIPEEEEEEEDEAAPTTTAASSSFNLPRPTLQSSTSISSSQSRLENFTEAVPLSLSSMAHASLPLQEGVLDGIQQVLGHTMLSCVNYARIMHPPHDWTFSHLCTSPFAWMPVKAEDEEANQLLKDDLPFGLSKLKFSHFYSRTAYLYLRPAMPTHWHYQDEEFQFVHHASSNWPQRVGVLGCIKLLYASTEPLTRGELDGTDIEDIPPTILYKVVVEYRSLPATGNPSAVAAEELSMLSFGGSVDDDVKYGALASLYDATAPYVLEIYSVRGKKYKFDLMDATLSNGSIPRLPSATTNNSNDSSDKSSGAAAAPKEKDPFVKSLCVTVTDHSLSQDYPAEISQEEAEKKRKQYAITRMHLTLEGKIRGDLNHLPTVNFVSDRIAAAFRALDPRGGLASIAQATPSGHTLLLDPHYAGRIYVNGRYVMTWGQSSGGKDASHGVALFGMDLHSVPTWHNRIVDYQAMRRAYGQLWQEVMIDANLLPLQIAQKLLHRLISGKDPATKEKDASSSHADDDKDDDDDDDYEYDDDAIVAAVNTTDCLEAEVLSSVEYDMVGIAAKALATRFAMEFGKFAFPCQAHEVDYVKTNLPGRRPIIVVPQRLICILRRGGYFDAQRTLDDLWFESIVPLHKMDESAAELVNRALELLEAAGCEDISPEQVGFVMDDGDGIVYPGCIASRGKDKNVVITEKVVCRYKEVSQQYCIHAGFLKSNVMEYTDTPGDEALDQKVRAYLLGMYLAQAHPDGTLLARYLLRNKAPTSTSATMGVASPPASPSKPPASPGVLKKSTSPLIDI